MSTSVTEVNPNPKHPIQFSVPEEAWLEMKQIMPHRGEISSVMTAMFHKLHQTIKKENIQYGNRTRRDINNVIERLTFSSALREGHLKDE